MSFRRIVLLLLCCVPLSVVAEAEAPLLILNQPKERVCKPRHFRKMSDSFHFHGAEQTPSRIGLEALRASGSAQFSVQSLRAILHQLPPKVIIIDLRQESHGFLNEMPVSWYGKNNWENLGKSLSWIEADETKRLECLAKMEHATVHQLIHENMEVSVRAFQVFVRSVLTEREICKREGKAYLRIPVTDHDVPEDAQIDRFVAFVKALPIDGWLHLHCAGGMGRTTTFLCMYDMMRNANQVSFEDILKRQWLLGGQNLFSEASASFQKWPGEFLQREKMLKLFYTYCRQQMGTFHQSWSSWLQSLNSSPR